MDPRDPNGLVQVYNALAKWLDVRPPVDPTDRVVRILARREMQRLVAQMTPDQVAYMSGFDDADH